MMKKTEAKEEGTTSKHIRVVYSDKKRRRIIYFLASLILLLICVFSFSYFAIQPRVPRFILDDLYVDSTSNFSLMVKLSSTNPSPKSSVYYNKIGLHVWIEGGFETENVFLEKALQEPREVTIWTAVLATNNGNNDKPSGSFLVRDGLTNGDVIADLSIQWKSGIFSSLKYSLLVKCPLLLNLKDLTSVVPKPMSTCSHHFT